MLRTATRRGAYLAMTTALVGGVLAAGVGPASADEYTNSAAVGSVEDTGGDVLTLVPGTVASVLPPVACPLIYPEPSYCKPPLQQLLDLLGVGDGNGS